MLDNHVAHADCAKECFLRRLHEVLKTDRSLVYALCVCALCVHGVCTLCVHGVCTLCVHGVCTLCVHGVCTLCVHGVCTLCVHGVCTLCVHGVCTLCVHGVCTLCVHGVCTLCVHDVCALCVHDVCTLCVHGRSTFHFEIAKFVVTAYHHKIVITAIVTALHIYLRCRRAFPCRTSSVCTLFALFDIVYNNTCFII